MRNPTPAERFDKLSNLSAELQKIEQTDIRNASAGLTHTRNSIKVWLQILTHGRFHAGRVLRQYKMYYKSERGWVAAAKVIGAAMDRDERTVFRIIEDYERASQLPPITLEAMLEQKIDPAARKNEKVIENLLDMPEPETREEANAAVSAAVRKDVARKRERKKAATVSTELSVDEFATRIVKQFQNRYGSANLQEKLDEVKYVLEVVVNTLRVPIVQLRQYGRPALVPKPVKKGVA